MYERFTDRARKVMHLANQEAQRFNHEYLGTEHILLGLVKEGSGVAAAVLRGLDADLRKIRLEIEKRMQSGPEVVTLEKLPFTPRAKSVINHTLAVAQEQGDDYVGTEHLLLGLLRELEGVAGQVLTALGITTEAVQNDIALLLGKPARLEAIPPVSEPEPVAQRDDQDVNVIRLLRALPAMVRAVRAAVDELRPQICDRPMTLSPETAELLFASGLELDGPA